MKEKKKAKLFIDIDNIIISFKEKFGYEIDFKKVLDFIEKKLSIIKSETIAIGNINESYNKAIIENLRNQGIVPRKTEHYRKANSADAEICIEMLIHNDIYTDLESFVLMTGDGDFRKVVAHLANHENKEVIIFAVNGSISKSLQNINKDLVKIWYLDEIALERLYEVAEKAIIEVEENPRHWGYSFKTLQDKIAYELDCLPDIIGEQISKLIEKGRLVQENKRLDNGEERRMIEIPNELNEDTKAKVKKKFFGFKK